MKKKAKIIIFLSVLLLVILILTQLFMVKKAIEIEYENKEIVNEIKYLEDKNYKSEVIIALTKVRDRLISMNTENSNIYLDPVKQIQPNYFVVSFYDTIPKDILKELISEEFKTFYIENNYQIGIYDCFTDSIIFDEYTDEFNSRYPLKWEHDGYYFGVYFNEVPVIELADKSSLPFMLILSILVFLLGAGFTFYLAGTILKQKKISKITYDFINNMTHELKTPISTISLSTDVLLNDKGLIENERLARYLSIIKTENKRLENQVERVLQIAKLDKDVIKLNFEKIDIHEVIKTCVNTFGVPIQDRDGTINESLEATNSNIMGDNIHITNIIYNLFDNANKYSPNKPILNIKTYNDSKRIFIQISDKGLGIKKEDCKEIFSKFYRVSTGDVHNVKGFGLGLYYVKEMVEKHGGMIQINSKIGEGSTFTITFPSMNEQN